MKEKSELLIGVRGFDTYNPEGNEKFTLADMSLQEGLGLFGSGGYFYSEHARIGVDSLAEMAEEAVVSRLGENSNKAGL